MAPRHSAERHLSEQHNNVAAIFLFCRVSTLICYFAEWHFACLHSMECHLADERHSFKCHFAKCHCSVSFMLVPSTGCHYSDCLCQCHPVKCHSAECHSTGCLGAGSI